MSNFSIHQLQSLTALTQADFKKLYLSTIKNFTDFLQESNSPLNISDQLSTAILALKCRRAYLLPIGAESEVSFKEREEWTYAVFIAGLLKEIDISIRFEVVQKIMPDSGFLWLKQNDSLFSLWKSYLTGESSTTVFSIII